MARLDYPHPLRWIGCRDGENKKTYVILTNNFILVARTIAQIYKSPWQTELLIKWIKHHLKIEAFWGASSNVVKTQIWIAMRVYLMLFWIKRLCRSTLPLLGIIRRLQLNLLSPEGYATCLFLRRRHPKKTQYTNQLTFAKILTGH